MKKNYYSSARNWLGNLVDSVLGKLTIVAILSMALASCNDKEFTIGERTFEIKDIEFKDSLVMEGGTHYAGREHAYLLLHYFETEESFTKNKNKFPSTKEPVWPILIDEDKRRYALKFSYTTVGVGKKMLLNTLVYGSIPKKSGGFKLITKDKTVRL